MRNAALISFGIAAALALPLRAQGAAEDGVRLFAAGRYAEAEPLLAAAARVNPRDTTAAF